MAASLVRKILERASAGAAGGSSSRVRWDVLVLDEEAFALVGAELERRAEELRAQAARVCLIAGGIPRAADSDLWRRMRRLAERTGAVYVPPGRGGRAAVECADRGLLGPGSVVLAPDDTFWGLGALGALVVRPPDRDALVEAALSGAVEAMPPAQTWRIQLSGSPGRWAGGFDVAARVVLEVGAEVSGRAVEVELTGPAVDAMDVVERIAACDVLARRFGGPVLVPPDERTLAWVRARRVEDAQPLLPDRDAADERRSLDVTGAAPSVERPDGSLVRVTELPDTALDYVVLGGEIGGRVEDLRTASRLLKEHPVPDSLRCYVVAANQRAQIHAIDEGAAGRLLRAGALFCPAATAPADPRGGPEEAGLTTSAAPSLGAFRASAAVAAASAAMGRIAHPDEVLRAKRISV